MNQNGKGRKYSSNTVFFTLKLIFSFAALAPVHAHVPDFFVSGVVDCKYYVDGRLSENNSFRFNATVSACKYSIHLDPMKANRKAQGIKTEAIELAYDGTNNFLIRRFSTNVISTVWDVDASGVFVEKTLKVPVKPKNSGDIRITSGMVPPGENLGVSTVWLAFASACYYNNQKNGVSAAFRHESLTFLGEAYSRFNIVLDGIVAFGSDSRFVSRREDYHDSILFRTRGGKLTQEKIDLGITKYTNSIYKVLEETNQFSLHLPRRFSFETYGPNVKEKTIELRMSCDGTTETIELRDGIAEIRPSVIDNATIRDTRVEVGGWAANANYFSKDGPLLSVEELKNRIEQKRKPTLVSEALVFHTSHVRKIFLVFIISSTVFFPIAGFVWWRKSQNKNQH